MRLRRSICADREEVTRTTMSLPRISAWLLAAAVTAGAGCKELLDPSSPVGPSNGAWRLSGTVSSTAGARIAGARLTVQEGTNKDARATTDLTGHFVFEKLQSGRFKVIIEAPGFVSVTPVVELYWDIDVDFALRRPDEIR